MHLVFICIYLPDFCLKLLLKLPNAAISVSAFAFPNFRVRVSKKIYCFIIYAFQIWARRMVSLHGMHRERTRT